MKNKNSLKIKILSTILAIVLLSVPLLLFSSCKKDSETESKNIKLFNTQTKSIDNLSLENYLEGVVAGEIQNDAPIEALKAQAVLARTFTLNFLENNSSKYDGADISTDINEAQAYNQSYINDNIRKAVKETSGIFVSKDNQYINAWFHSNSGGITATAKEGLGIYIDEPSYIKSVQTEEKSNNTKNYNWSATFSKDEILNALRNMGVSISNISSFTIDEKGQSGRVSTFLIGGKEVSANTFRLNIGSTKMKSTLIDKISINNNNVYFEGRGYGHGVGLSQEYAIVLANKGYDYKQIINFFFKDVQISSKK